jgi:hypothetical protein
MVTACAHGWFRVRQSCLEAWRGRAEDEHDENDPGEDVQHTDVVTSPELDFDPETPKRNL